MQRRFCGADSLCFALLFIWLFVLSHIFYLPSFAQVPGVASEQATNTISGIVSEAASGEAVIGITAMVVRDTALLPSGNAPKPISGTRTNKFGFYSIPNLPQGTYFLVVRGIGYKNFVKKILVEHDNIRLNVPLQTQDVRGKQVTIETGREAAATRSISTVELNTEFAKKMPVLGGESDIFRTLQLMPGIKSGSELSSGLYIRGGSPDQNLILLDGVTVYNPSHLGGFLSTFNSDAIRDVRVIKGAFPAEYGGRLSGIVDMTMKEGSKEKFSGTGNISLLASRLTVEGPITEDVTFMVSGRRFYLDLLARAVVPDLPVEYYFYDLNAKLNWKISDNDRLYLSGYFGRDVAGTLTQAGSPSNRDPLFSLGWGNATANLRWMHVVSPSLFTNFSAIFTDYQFSVGIPDTLSGFFSLSRIRDFTLRGDAQYFPSKEHVVKIGFDATYHNFTSILTAQNKQVERFLQQLGLDSSQVIPALEAAVYAQDEWEDAFGLDGLSLNAGFRLAYFQQGNRFLPEPRLSFAYNLGQNAVGNNFKVKGAFAVANQFLHLVVRNDITLPTDTWFPSTQTIQPANSTQFVLGAETTLFDNDVLVSVEGYYKSMRNLLEFKDNANFSNIFSTRESDLTVGTGESYGMEVFINKRIGDFTGWIGYTLSWTTRTFPELNGGKTFFPRYDSRHDIAVTLNYKLSESWELGAAWVFQSGQAYTMPSGTYFSNASSTLIGSGSQLPPIFAPQRFGFPQMQTLTTERNGGRLPAYHRLDVNFSHYFSWFNLPFTLSLNVFNVYNRWNPFAWGFGFNYRTGSRELQQITIFPIIPTVGIGFKF